MLKILIVIWLGTIWAKLLGAFVGDHAACGIFLLQAIYCRIRFMRDSQIVFDDEKNPIILYPEVID